MTIVLSNRQRIFYRFEGDKGAYLLLHHGLFGSHRDWIDAGYVKELEEDFRLILVDARGHGRSDRPVDPEGYKPEYFADDIIAIMEELGIHNLHFFGYGFGALVGLELLLKYPDRVRIIMMGGASPFVDDAMKDGWRTQAEAIRTQNPEAPSAILPAASRSWKIPILPGQDMTEEDVAENDRAASLALLEALTSIPLRPDSARMSVNSPVALFTGENDPAAPQVEQARRRIHRARFVSIPGEDHAGLFRERDALITEIMRLLRSGKRPSESFGQNALDHQRVQGNGTFDEPKPQVPTSQDPKPQDPREGLSRTHQERESHQEDRSQREEKESGRPESGQGEPSLDRKVPEASSRPASEGESLRKPTREARQVLPPTGAAHGPPRGMIIDLPEAHHVEGEEPDIAQARPDPFDLPPEGPPPPNLQADPPSGGEPPPEAQAEVEVIHFNQRTSIVVKEGDTPPELAEAHDVSGIPPVHLQDSVYSQEPVHRQEPAPSPIEGIAPANELPAGATPEGSGDDAPAREVDGMEGTEVGTEEGAEESTKENIESGSDS